MLAFGTRPEAIKMAPVYRALLADENVFEPFCCVTAQHRHMLDQALAIFGIAPRIDLDLMRSGQGLADLSAAVLSAMTAALGETAPDLVLVHGDTTTSMATALAAFHAGVPVGHVEAGLRTGDMRSPFPEECNRRIVGLLASHHFAPTEAARANLLHESCDPASIVVTGNTVVDAMTSVLADIDASAPGASRAGQCLDEELGFDWRSDRFILVTCHRRETFTRGLIEVCDALVELADSCAGVRFVLPVHPNPMVRGPIEARLRGHPSIHLTAPLAYDVFLLALRSCHLVMTDSGGIQEEAPSLGKPVLVMRDVTERPEAVDAGAARLIGSSRAGIVAAAAGLLNDERAYSAMVVTKNPFGDGRAGERIAAFLRDAWIRQAWPDRASALPPRGQGR